MHQAARQACPIRHCSSSFYSSRIFQFPSPVARLSFSSHAAEILLNSLVLVQFVHDSIDSLASGHFKAGRYEGVPPADLEAVSEAYKLFLSQSVNLGLNKEQVRLVFFRTRSRFGFSASLSCFLASLHWIGLILSYNRPLKT